MDGEQTLIAHSWDTISRSAVDRLAHRLSVILAKDNEEKVRSEMVRVITAWDAAAAALRRITSRWKSGITLVCVVGSWDKGAAGQKARPTQAGFRREKPSLGKAEEQKVRLREADI